MLEIREGDSSQRECVGGGKGEYPCIHRQARRFKLALGGDIGEEVVGEELLVFGAFQESVCGGDLKAGNLSEPAARGIQIVSAVSGDKSRSIGLAEGVDRANRRWSDKKSAGQEGVSGGQEGVGSRGQIAPRGNRDRVSRAECVVGVSGLALEGLRLGVEGGVGCVIETVTGDDGEEVVGCEEVVAAAVSGDEAVGKEVAAAGNVDE